MNSNKDKWVLVTGGTRGIGRGLVEALCTAGYKVVFTYKASREAADGLTREMAALSFTAHGYCCDSSDEDAVRAFAEMALGEYGAPHGIINNAGITRDAALLNMRSDQWLDVVNVNLNAAFFITRQFARSMVECGDGVILQMSSVSGLKGNMGQTNYAATKAALSGMTRSLALELGRFNVRANAIAPGYIATEMIVDLPERQMKAVVGSIPLRRVGTVREVAGLATFMLSEEGAYITGQTFVVDGGLSA